MFCHSVTEQGGGGGVTPNASLDQSHGHGGGRGRGRWVRYHHHLPPHLGQTSPPLPPTWVKHHHPHLGQTWPGSDITTPPPGSDITTPALHYFRQLTMSWLVGSGNLLFNKSFEKNCMTNGINWFEKSIPRPFLNPKLECYLTTGSYCKLCPDN